MRNTFHKGFTLVEILVVIAIIGFILAIALPNYLKTTTASKKNVCINNLKQIEAAVDQWAMDHSIPAGTQPNEEQESEIYSYVKGGKPSCPSGGSYTIYPVGYNSQVRCSREDEGHKLSED